MLKLSPVICICGSLKYWDELIQANAMLVTKSIISVASGFSMKYPDKFPVVAEHVANNPREMKKIFDTLHFQKILLSDGIWVLNVDDYIGYSTKREIMFAQAIGKRIFTIESCSFCDEHDIKYEIVRLNSDANFPDNFYQRTNKYYVGDVVDQYEFICNAVDGK